MEYHFVKWRTSLFRNGVLLSEMNLLGTPKRPIIFSLGKLATKLHVAFFMPIVSTHFVNSSVATNIQAHPSEGGFIGSMNSSPQLWKGYGAIVG